jgi:hypothetical protein
MRYTEGSSEWSPGPDVNVVSPRPKKSNRNKILAGVLGALVLMCCGLSIPVLASMLDQDDPVSVGGQIEVPSPVSTMPTPPAKAAPKTIGEGQWIVGEDVEAGRYKTEGADPDILALCVWTVYKTEGQNPITFGSTDQANAPGRVTLRKGNAFHTTGCKPWVRQAS